MQQLPLALEVFFAQRQLVFGQRQSSNFDGEISARGLKADSGVAERNFGILNGEVKFEGIDAEQGLSLTDEGPLDQRWRARRQQAAYQRAQICRPTGGDGAKARDHRGKVLSLKNLQIHRVSRLLRPEKATPAPTGSLVALKSGGN